MISIFLLWTFLLNVAAIQKHLHMEYIYISPSWCDMQEGVVHNKKVFEPRVPSGSVEVITPKVLRSPSWFGYPLRNRCRKWPRICSVCRVVITIWSFPHSWVTTGFVTRVTRRIPHVEQILLTLPEHLSSSSVFSGVRVSLGFC